jgi:hypothetical protein
MPGTDSPRPPRLPRFARRRPRRQAGRGVRWVELLHKLVTGAAALAALFKALF